MEADLEPTHAAAEAVSSMDAVAEAPVQERQLDPVPLEPVPLDPVLLDPVPLEPVPLEPVPLEPVPLAPVPLEPGVERPLELVGDEIDVADEPPDFDVPDDDDDVMSPVVDNGEALTETREDLVDVLAEVDDEPAAPVALSGTGADGGPSMSVGIAESVVGAATLPVAVGVAAPVPIVLTVAPAAALDRDGEHADASTPTLSVRMMDSASGLRPSTSPLLGEGGIDMSTSHMDMGIGIDYAGVARDQLALPIQEVIPHVDVSETEAGAHQREQNLAILRDLDSIADEPGASPFAASVPVTSPMPAPTPMPQQPPPIELPAPASAPVPASTSLPEPAEPAPPSVHIELAPAPASAAENKAVAETPRPAAVPTQPETAIPAVPTASATRSRSSVTSVAPEPVVVVAAAAERLSPSDEAAFVRALWLVSSRPHGTPPVRERQNSISAEEPAAAPGPVAPESVAPPSPEKSAGAGAPRPSATLAVPGAAAAAATAAVLLPSVIDPSKFAPAVSIDMLTDAIGKHFGPNNNIPRSVLEVGDVDFSDDGLVRLMASNSWRAAATLAKGLLTAPSAAALSVDARLQIFACRQEALIKLRQFEAAMAEVEALGDLSREALFWSKQPHDTAHTFRRASYVPFGLRLLHAELPQHVGNGTLGLDRLYALLSVIRGIIAAVEAEPAFAFLANKSAATALWRERELAVQLLIVNQLHQLRDFPEALQMLEAIVAKAPEKLVHQSQLARLHMQMGNTAGASSVILRVEKRIGHMRTQGHAVTAADQQRLNLDRGLLAMAAGHYADAVTRFEECLAENPSNVQVVNNLAVAHLYTGKLRQAIVVLEDALRRDPQASLNETLIFNLSTLYELESEGSIEKKKTVMVQAAKHYGDHFNTECLKSI